MSVTRGQILRYTMLPGIMPRIRSLFAGGFQYIPFFLALVYQGVGLLPRQHPYANPANIGRFGLRHVIAEVANGITFSRKNADKVILFFAIMMAVVLVFAQILIAFIGLFLGTASASMPTDFSGFFITPNPTNDMAHMMMDMVFGVPGMFDSCIALGSDCNTLQPGLTVGGMLSGSSPLLGFSFSFLGIFTITLDLGSLFGGSFGGAWGYAIPHPIHNGLHDLFLIYNTGLLVVGAFIALYFVTVVIVETAQTGTPFGKRFNKVWAPIRFVAAFGLLIPIAYGMNTSQFIVLYAAKFGSGFATNGWILFNDVLTGSYLGDLNSLIARPNIPEIGALLQFLYVAKVCAEYEEINERPEIKPYLVRNVLQVPPNLEVDLSTPYQSLGGGTASAIDFAEGSSILTLRFGVFDEENYGVYKGFVKPVCGEMQFFVNDGSAFVQSLGGGFGFLSGGGFSGSAGATLLEEWYWDMVKEIWFVDLEGPPNYPENVVKYYGTTDTDPNVPLPDEDFKDDLYSKHVSGTELALTAAIIAQQAVFALNQSLTLPELEARGWGGAAIWYNRIAEMNGALTSAVFAVPAPVRFPEVMENVRAQKRASDGDVDNSERFNPQLAGGQDFQPGAATDIKAAKMYNEAYQFWQSDGRTGSSHTTQTGNAMIDIINHIFGTEGLFNMRENADTHPLAQLAGVGRSLIEAAVRNLGYATVLGLGGVLTGGSSPFVGETLSVLSSFLVTIVIIQLTLGFVLFYVVPFLPFIYYFFALGGWIKGIFEAMVGAPLWALSHLRIDGEGLPGQASVNGYFLIFEVFLRPILILFGLLASISIYSALVKVLNETFDLVVSNLTGFDARSEFGSILPGFTGAGPGDIEFYRAPLDEFFFTIIYCVIVYMMGLASFKLIDQIPNNILRWMGQNVTTFNDSREDPAQGLVSTAYIGGQQTFSAVGGGLSSLAGAGRTQGG